MPARANAKGTSTHQHVPHAKVELFAHDTGVHHKIKHAYEVLAVTPHALVLEAHVVVQEIEAHVHEVHVANLETFF